jgi:voltage-gated potassium channel
VRELRRRTHKMLGLDEPDDPASRYFDIALSVLILLNIAALILGTVDRVETRYGAALHAFEVFSVVLFTIEYMLRLWSIVEDPRYSRPVIGRIRWALTGYAIADAIAIVPFYFTIGSGIDLRFVRALRLLRLARVIKLGRYSEGIQALGRVLRTKLPELISATVVLLVMLILSSGALFYAEHDAQPEKFANLPLAIFWAFSVMVGEVGTIAETTLGRFIVAFIALLGVGLFALPAGILASGLVQVLRDDEAAQESARTDGRSNGSESGTRDPRSERPTRRRPP